MPLPRSRSATTLLPCDLRCEGRVAAVGIEARPPALSWRLAPSSGARGQRQTAYHIVAATSPALLDPAHADRWDSGIVASSVSTAVAYGGARLRSLERIYWAVRVRDEAGSWSAWEKSGTWTMGLLDPAQEWVADWIHLTGTASSSPNDPDPNERPINSPDPWFRRELHLDVAPERAVALVASIGFHELYVNGQKVGDAVLMPNVTDVSRRGFYVPYEIAPYLRPGPNVLALWLGSGWSVYRYFSAPDRPRQPFVSAQFHFETRGSTRLLLTDSAWLARPSPSRLIGTWDFQNFGGESYDARAEIPGWAEPALPLDGWTPVGVWKQRLPLSADPADPNRRQQELRPVAVAELSAGVHRIDFGRSFAGFVEVDLTGAPGTRVSLEFSEAEDRSMTHLLHSEYIIGHSGAGTFRSRFNYACGRWLTLRGAIAPPRLADLRAWCVRNDYRSVAAFESSSEKLNAIVNATRWTFENLTIGGFVADCPHRERMGYGGDGHATLLSGLYHYRWDALLGKWNADWQAVQGHPPAWSSPHDPSAVEPPPSGHPGEMPYTAPTYWGGGGPAWSGFCVHLPWQLYRFYGDRRVLERSLPVIERWLDFLETKVAGHLLRRWGGKWDFLGDWLSPDRPRGVNSDRPETLFFNNCYRIWSLSVAAKAARAVDAVALAEQWERRAAQSREAVHAAFHDPAAASYVDGSQVSLAVALLAEIPPPPLRPAIEDRLENEIRHTRNGHICAGITGGALLFHYLLENDRHDLLHLMVSQSGYPGWAYMLERGATTLWETWDEPTGNLSRLHSSFLYVGVWPIGGVLGLSPIDAAPGFSRVRLCPGPIDAPDLIWARGHFESVRGRIAVAWRREAETFTLDVELPPGVEAEIGLPVTDPGKITESGQPLAAVRGLGMLRRDASRTFLAVPAGAYSFRCTIDRPADFAGGKP